jgi:hypothetical protein
MTNRIIDFIVRNELRAAQERLEKLMQIKAPEVMIQGQKRIVEELSAGKIKVGGDQELLQCTFETFETKKGKGGKVYVQFDNGIKYFPNAKYGRFIAR